MRTSTLFVLFAMTVLVAGQVKINYRRCDKGNGPGRNAARACEKNFCPDSPRYKGRGVNVVQKALDKFSGCKECWKSRCDLGDTEYCESNPIIANAQNIAPQPGQSVAVIGGGISGLFAARQLKQSGYHVTVYEAESELAGTTESLEADGFVFDFATKFIMPNTPLGPMQESMMQMIEDYGMTLRDSVPSVSWFPNDDPTTGPNLSTSLPHALLGYVVTEEARIKFAQDLVMGHVFLASLQANGVRTVEDLVNFGIIDPADSYYDWAQKVNIPGFTDLLGFIHDGFLQGNAFDQPAALVINVRRNMLPGLLKQLFLAFGFLPGTPAFGSLPAVTQDFISTAFVPTGASHTNFAGSWTFEEGCQEFFNRLAINENIDVKLNHRVHTIRFQNNRVWINSNGGPSQLFDYAVVAVQPHQADQMLRFHPEMQAIYARVNQFDPKVSWALRATSPGELPAEYASFIFPDAFFFPPDASITAVAKDYAASDVVFAIGYSNDALNPDQVRTEMMDDMAAAGFTVTEELGLREYEYPVHVNVEETAAGWFQDAAALQGVGNLFYVGEIFSGPNIPNLLDHVEKVIPQFFPSANLKSADKTPDMTFYKLNEAMEKGFQPKSGLDDLLTPEERDALDNLQVDPQGDLAELIDYMESHEGDDKSLPPTPSESHKA